MNTLLRSVVALMSLALFGSPGAWKGAAADLVWRVQSGTNRIYLAGSIHYLRPSDYPLPSSFDFAFQSARLLILEADLDAATTPAFQAYVQSKAQFPAGTSLKTHITSQLYGLIQGFAVQNGLPATTFDIYRPWFVGAYVAGDKYRDQGLSSDLGVDQHYFGRAKQLTKPRKFLETPQQGIDAFAVSAESDSVKGLSAQFGLLPASQYPVQTGAQLIAKWRAGQIEAFEEDITVMSREAPSLFDNIVRKRNQAWLPQIESQLKSGEVAFVLVGALHFAGTEGLLAQLRTKGYAITQLPSAELAPTVTVHPQPVTVTVGQSVQFSVTATGTEPFTYQWQRNSQNIPAATGPTFSIASAQLTNAGDYRVIVGNFVGSATSLAAKLTVNPAAVAPVITTPPQSVTVSEGQPLQLSVVATGTAPLSFQWRRGGVDLPGATAATLAYANAHLTNAGSYVVVVRNGAGQITSVPALVTVNPVVVTMRLVRLRFLPTGELDADVNVSPGRDYHLEATSDFKAWTPAQTFSAAQAEMTVRTPGTGATARFYRIREGAGVSPAPVIVQQPADQFALVGKLASFTVKAEGAGPFTYQWLRDDAPLPGKISATLIFFSTKLTDAGNYRVVVTGPGGSTPSNEVTLTVDAP